MNVAWIVLLIAGVFEWGWPIGLKYAWRDGQLHALPLVFAILCMTISGALLLFAQRTIPVGTAYAVWTGIGAMGTFVLGIVLLGEPAQALRFVCVGFILAGIVGLKLVSPP